MMRRRVIDFEWVVGTNDIMNFTVQVEPWTSMSTNASLHNSFHRKFLMFLNMFASFIFKECLKVSINGIAVHVMILVFDHLN
jgi:hypothetical protein